VIVNLERRPWLPAVLLLLLKNCCCRNGEPRREPIETDKYLYVLKREEPDKLSLESIRSVVKHQIKGRHGVVAQVQSLKEEFQHAMEQLSAKKGVRAQCTAEQSLVASAQCPAEAEKSPVTSAPSAQPSSCESPVASSQELAISEAEEQEVVAAVPEGQAQCPAEDQPRVAAKAYSPNQVRQSKSSSSSSRRSGKASRRVLSQQQ